VPGEESELRNRLRKILGGEDMKNFVQLLAFGAGALCLGGTLTLGLMFSLAGRHSYDDSGEGCLSTFLCLIGLGLAAYFFFVAVTG
jgi:hypothetical protein